MLNLLFPCFESAIFIWSLSTPTYSEYMNWDLRVELAANKEKYKDGKRVNKFMKGLLSGLAYCHSHKILHRDIKPENLLLSGDELKIADFGAARGFTTHSSTSDSPSLSPDVVTVDYRPPEVLGAAGCILGEMLSPIPSPIFGPAVNDGHDSLLEYEKKVLEKNFRFLGTPEENNWSALSKLKFADQFQFPEDEPLGLEKLVPGLDAFPDQKIFCRSCYARILKLEFQLKML
ncbi:cell division control protein 2 homolog isoform X2 [Argentina anserina]|uniref:cell division control protein 2 homolog isoform X2 n=1 Tax=Argentina anserina TaxID=57926 RepID=UPI0021764ED9|nr:cell division control protein 2 homolog isoform X2 [Potentilla anserina]